MTIIQGILKKGWEGRNSYEIIEEYRKLLVGKHIDKIANLVDSYFTIEPILEGKKICRSCYGSWQLFAIINSNNTVIRLAQEEDFEDFYEKMRSNPHGRNRIIY